MTLEQLESELRKQPAEVRDYLAGLLIETLEPADDDEDGVEAEAHRRYLELESGAVKGIDGDEVIAQLQARRRR
jgi:Putative addiction module component